MKYWYKGPFWTTEEENIVIENVSDLNPYTFTSNELVKKVKAQLDTLELAKKKNNPDFTRGEAAVRSKINNMRRMLTGVNRREGLKKNPSKKVTRGIEYFRYSKEEEELIFDFLKANPIAGPFTETYIEEMASFLLTKNPDFPKRSVNGLRQRALLIIRRLPIKPRKERGISKETSPSEKKEIPFEKVDLSKGIDRILLLMEDLEDEILSMWTELEKLQKQAESFIALKEAIKGFRV